MYEITARNHVDGTVSCDRVNSVSATPTFLFSSSAPRIKPQNFTHSSETDNSVNLSWKAIPPADQRGFLTHYSLCSVKISSPEVRKGVMSLFFLYPFVAFSRRTIARRHVRFDVQLNITVTKTFSDLISPQSALTYQPL